MKDWLELFIQYYKINLLFLEFLLLKKLLFSIPKELKKSIIIMVNIQNDDNECFI